MTGDQKDELIAAQDRLIFELVESLETIITWAHRIDSEYLDGEPGVLTEYLKDMSVARAVVAKAHGAK